MDYTGKNKLALIALCRERGIEGYAGKNRAEVLALLTAATHLTPLVKWSGGKGDEIAKILPYLPTTYTTYLEPFIGGGALYFYLNPAHAVINDIHPQLIDLYRTVGEGGRGAIKEFMTANKNEDEVYYKVRDEMNPQTPLEKAKQFYYLRKTCYRGMLRYNSSGKFNIPFGRYKSINFSDLDNPAYETLLARTTILNGSYLDVFRDYNSPDNFMFLDPPYDSKFTDYGYCSFDKKNQEDLAAAFKATSIKCLMIIGKTEFISKLYSGYIVGEYDKKYRFKLHSGRVGDEINTKHLVIKNY
jgi:DNA adenine methylase